jgi:CRP-like cAMP-binding protein
VGWQQTLERQDVAWFPRATGRIHVEAPSGARQDFDLVQVSGPLFPSVAARLVAAAAQPALLVADSASPAAVAVVDDAGHSLVTADGRILLHVGTETLRAEAPTPIRAARSRGPKPWGQLHVVRRLLEARRPLTQTDIGQLAGLSQERVSRVLNPLRQLGLVTRTRDGETVPNREALLDWWLAAYPRDAALAAHYYAADSLPDQLHRAATAHQGRRVALSGDLAADAVAPWRVPRRVLLYSGQPADLSTAGFVPSGAKEATLTVVTSPDPGVFMPTGPSRPPQRHDETQHELGEWDVHRESLVELADPLQVLLDVAGGDGPDAGEAAAVLRREVLCGEASDSIADWMTDCLDMGVLGRAAPADLLVQQTARDSRPGLGR